MVLLAKGVCAVEFEPRHGAHPGCASFLTETTHLHTLRPRLRRTVTASQQSSVRGVWACAHTGQRWWPREALRSQLNRDQRRPAVASGATEAAPLTVQLSYSRARVGARARVHGARTHGGARAQRPDYRRALRTPGSANYHRNALKKGASLGPRCGAILQNSPRIQTRLDP